MAAGQALKWASHGSGGKKRGARGAATALYAVPAWFVRRRCAMALDSASAVGP